MKSTFFCKEFKIHGFKIFFITNLIENKKFIKKLMNSTIEEYLDILPTTLDGYDHISDFDGKPTGDRFVCKMKPKKPTSHEFVVIKGVYIDLNSDTSELEKTVIFIKKKIKF